MAWIKPPRITIPTRIQRGWKLKRTDLEEIATDLQDYTDATGDALLTEAATAAATHVAEVAVLEATLTDPQSAIRLAIAQFGGGSTPGTPGSVWTSSSSVPADNAGAINDMHLVFGGSGNGNVYRKTGASTWTLQGNIAPSAALATTTTAGRIQIAGDLGGTATEPTVPGLADRVTHDELTTALGSVVNGADVRMAQAADVDAMFSGVVTRDSNGAPTSASVVWPDGRPGVYLATTVSSNFPGAVDAYTVTYVPVTGPTKTYTQPAVSRNGAGQITTRPVITVA